MAFCYRDRIALPETVNHRYVQAKEAVRKGERLPRTSSDPLTRELYKALRRRQADQARNRDPRSDCCDADVVRAIEIRESQQGTLRSQIEAWLLTDLPFEEIGTRVHQSARVVEIYALCFLHVRQEMSEPELLEVVEAFKATPPDRLYQDYFWKKVALTGNVEMLETLMSPAKSQTAEEVATASAAEAKFLLQHQVTEAAKAVDVTDPNLSRELRRIAEDMKEVQPNDEHRYVLGQIDKMCQSLAFAVGPPRPETASPDNVTFAKTSVELGLEDTLRVGLGLEPRNKEVLQAIRFPTGPDDREALSIQGMPDQPSHADKESADNGDGGGDGGGDDAGAENGDLSVHTAPPSANEVPEANPEMRRNLSNMGATFKRERIQREREAIEQKQANRQKAAQVATAMAEAAKALAEAAENERLDCEWEALAGDATGAIRNRMWLKFRKLHGGYMLKEARERLAALKKGK